MMPPKGVILAKIPEFLYLGSSFSTFDFLLPAIASFNNPFFPFPFSPLPMYNHANAQ